MVPVPTKLTLKLPELFQYRIDLREGSLMQFAELDDAIRVDNEQRSVRNASTVIKDAQALRGATMRPEIGQQRMTDPAH